MKIHEVIKQRIQRRAKGVNVASAVDATVAMNSDERGSTHTHSTTRRRIVQRNGRTVVSEEESSTAEGRSCADD